MRKKNKFLTVATLVASNANARQWWGGGVCIWRESGVKRSVSSWCVSQESGFSRREEVTHLFAVRNFINFVLSIRFTKIMLQ
jgi:hypothetical protein